MEIRESAEDYLERILMLNKSMGPGPGPWILPT